MTLSGTVSSDAVKTAVESAATAVTGDAAKVSSQLSVGSGSGSAGSGSKAGVQTELRQLPTITFRHREQLTDRRRVAGRSREAAQILKDNPQIKVRVQGHTDDVGDALGEPGAQHGAGKDGPADAEQPSASTTTGCRTSGTARPGPGAEHALRPTGRSTAAWSSWCCDRLLCRRLGRAQRRANRAGCLHRVTTRPLHVG